MEALGTIELGSSPQHERWVYLNLLQGELTRTVNSLEEVASSRVHIVEPDDSPFLANSSEGSASVTVQLQPGSSLTALQIRGITHLVAGAIKGLSAKQVILVDDSGNLLSGGREEDAGAIGSSNNILELKHKYESQYKRKLLTLLGRVIGSSQHISATVNVELNTEATEENKSAINPESGVVISEKINESTSKEQNPQGIPGAESNLPEQAPPQEEGNAQNKTQQATNYDYTRTSNRTIKPAGTINRISASVVIDLATAQNLIADTTDVTFESLQKEIEDVVKYAIGFTEVPNIREDKVKISFVPFAPMSVESFEAETESMGWLKDWRNFILIVLALFIIYFGMIRPFVNSMTGAMEDERKRKQLAAKSQNRRGDDDIHQFGDLDRLQLLARDFTTANKQELNNLVERLEKPSAEVLKKWIQS